MVPLRLPPLPTNTARATEAAFGVEHPYLKLGQHLEDILFNLDITPIASSDQELIDSLWPYALATILQYWEDLTDFQMANASRTRLDLKYALHLSKDFPGFEPSSLCRFRQLLIKSPTGKEVFLKIVNRLANFVTHQDKPPVTVDGILSNLCMLKQWELVMGTMSNVIESLAASQAEWLRSVTLPHWYKRYSKRPAFYSKHTSKNSKSMILTVGEDGQTLLNAVQVSRSAALAQMREIQMMKQIWQTLFFQEGDKLSLRTLNCFSCPGRLEMMAAKKIDRSENGVDFAEIATLPANSLRYTDYVGLSGYSNQASVLVDVPPAPTNVTSTNVSRTSLTFNWQFNFPQPDGFEVQVATNSSFTTIVQTFPDVTADQTSLAISGLSRNTRHYIRIRGFNAVGVGAWSMVLNVRTGR